MARFEFFKVGNNRTVGYDITLDQSIARDAFAYLITFSFFALIAGFLATVIPSLLFIGYFFTQKKDLWFVNLLILLISGYFLLDYHNGWICCSIFNSFEWFGLLHKIVILNTGLLMINFILLIHNLINIKKPFNDNYLSLDCVNWVLILTFFFVFMSNTLIKNDFISKYKEPVKTEEQIKVEHNQMY